MKLTHKQKDLLAVMCVWDILHPSDYFWYGEDGNCHQSTILSLMKKELITGNFNRGIITLKGHNTFMNMRDNYSIRKFNELLTFYLQK